MAKRVLTSKYNAAFQTTDPVRIELDCIAAGGQWKDTNGTICGMGTAYHVQAVARILWPWFRWHRWATDLIVPELTKTHSRVALFGPSNTGKSALTALVYLVFYFSRPFETTVLLASRTKDELDLRIWGEVKRLWSEAKEICEWLPGHLLDSKQRITTDGKEVEGREVRNGVIGRPCKVGGSWIIGAQASPFVGIKNKFVYLAFDEANLMPEGSLQALANLTANEYCSSAILGNLGDLNTPLGEAAEPENGWDALLDSETSRVYKTRWLNGTAVQLVGKDSPQLDFPEGHEPFGPLIGRRYLAQCEHDYGLDTPLYNMFAAGKIPRGTLENRVLTKAVCLRHGAFEPIEWGHVPLTRLYCADISYTASHGDRTVGMPIAFGPDVDGQLKLAPLERPLVYTPSDRASGTIEEQIAYQMQAECKRLSIPPENVFYDGTGRSSFTAAVMRLWSTAVNPVEFGGQASNRPNFLNRRYHEDRDMTRRKGELLPCNEIFGKFVTELWFALRYLVEAGQLRGLHEETAKEAYLRLWSLTAGNKMDVEPKDKMKLRLGRSPDLCDALVVGLEGARRLGFKLGALDVNAPKRASTGWLSRLNRDYKAAKEALELAAP